MVTEILFVAVLLAPFHPLFQVIRTPIAILRFSLLLVDSQLLGNLAEAVLNGHQVEFPVDGKHVKVLEPQLHCVSQEIDASNR